MLALRGRRLRRRLPKSQFMILLAVVGPGIIAANADNDASGIFGYSQAGAQYGYALLWVLVLVTFSLAVCQEMGARMGAVTGKGLADLIREEYGVKVTLFAMATLLIANYSTTVSEFAGITAAVQIFVPPYARWFIVPLTALMVWLLVTRGSYKRVERILLAASLVYLSYIISAFMAQPHWGDVARQTIWPARVKLNGAYVFMVINVIGTTITPWGQFYIQSSVRDKGVRVDQYGYARADVLFGAFFTNFIAYFIMVCCGATLFLHHIPATDGGQVAQALEPFAGRFATILFAIGLFNASCFGAITVPISTAYAVTEALGSESGVGRRAKEAPLFVGVFTILIVVSAATVLFGPQSLALLIILPNIVGGILLPIILVLTLLIINNRRVMGDYVNSRIYNLIALVTTAVLIVLAVALFVYAVPQLLHGGN